MVCDTDITVIIAAMQARDDERAAFVARNEGRTFGGTPRETSGVSKLIVSPSVHCRGGWRVTRFEGPRPMGHTECVSYAQAVEIADVDYGIVLSGVQFVT